jgi:hypothetical protein
MKKKEFKLDKEVYLKHSKDFEKVIDIKTAYQFSLILPFFVPIEDDSYMRIGTDEIQFIARYDSYENIEESLVDLSELTNISTHRKFNKTIIQIILLSDIEIQKEPNTTFFNNSLDKILHWINHVHLNLKIKTGHYHIERLTRKHLPTGMMCEYFNPKNWSERIKFVTITNTNEKETINKLSNTEWDWVVNDALQQKHSLFPFHRAENLAFKSLKAFKEGKFQDSTIFIQTSVEAFFKMYYLYFAAVNNIDEVKIDNVLKNFKGLIQDSGKKYLKGDWQIKEQNKVLYDYWTKTYELRNNIVHSAYQPVFEEARISLFSGLKLIELINSSLKEVGDIKNLSKGYYNEIKTYAGIVYQNDSSFASKEGAEKFMKKKLKEIKHER